MDTDHPFPPGYTRLSGLPSFVWLSLQRGETFSRVASEDEAISVLGDFASELAWRGFPTVGIRSDTGDLVSAPSATWRMHVPEVDSRHNGQAFAAFAGKLVLLSRPPEVWCTPAAETADIAEWFGASFQPERPDDKPIGLTNGKAAGHPHMHAWMKGYAEAFKDTRGAVIKREEALTLLAERWPGVLSREQERAYEDLPYPELRNPPRTPKRE